MVTRVNESSLWAARSHGAARLALAFVASSLLMTAGCEEDDNGGVPDAGDATDLGFDGDTSSDAGDAGDSGDAFEDPAVIPGGFPKDDCDPLNEAACALPWPSNLYLEPDSATETGYRLTFGETTLPKNVPEVHISPDLFDGLDGYGFGVPIIFNLGPLDYDLLPGEWDGTLGDSVESDSLTMLLRVDGDELVPVPHFVEPDLGVPDESVTFIRPAAVLQPNARYIVAIRGLETPEGDPVEAEAAFRELRDRIPSSRPAVASRRDHFEDIFARLEDHGVTRDDLILAWDFHTGSTQALHERLDQATSLALAEEPNGGSMTLTSLETFEPAEPADAVDAELRYKVVTEYTVPGVLKDFDLQDGQVLNLDASGNVVLGEDYTTRARIHVPHAAFGEEEPGVIVYGHGLFGGPEEINAGHLQMIAQDYNFIVVAIPLAGMAGEDVGPVSAALTNLNGFPVLADGLHQGIANHHLLTRFANSGALETFLQDNVDADIEIDETDVHYFGGSQGGIFGQTIVATSPDLRAGVLAVPGNNYSTLLPRSVNYAEFEGLMKAFYRDATDRTIILAALQLLWDRTDPVSYVDRLFNSEEYDGTERTGLFLLSKGDYQVSVMTNENVARTYPELAVMSGYDERVPFGITETSYPHDGSAMILFDFGNPWPEDRGSLPPEDGLTDPHPRIAEIEEAGDLLNEYLRNGTVIDICGGDGCNPR